MTRSTSYVEPRVAIEKTCQGWREAQMADDSYGVAMAVIDELAAQEGFVDDEGNANDGEIDLAASEWSAIAREWFAANPKTEGGRR